MAEFSKEVLNKKLKKDLIQLIQDQKKELEALKMTTETPEASSTEDVQEKLKNASLQEDLKTEPNEKLEIIKTKDTEIANLVTSNNSLEIKVKALETKNKNLSDRLEAKRKNFGPRTIRKPF